jgi:hypothetical protein
VTVARTSALGAALALTPLPALADPRIAGGTPAQTCEWPTAAAISYGGTLCSAVLAAPRLVITAGHCLTDSQYPTSIRFGETAASPARTIPVEYCRRSPDYDGGVGGTDLAFCLLAAPVPQIPPTPILLGCERDILYYEREVTIVGFGDSTPTGDSGSKRWAAARIASVVDEDSTQVGVGDAENASCSGDSGGPAYVQLPDGSWRVFGVVSGGSPGCAGGTGTYSLIDAHLPWIEEATGLDFTPCHDADGTWNPTGACQGFATDPQAGGDWDDWCEGARSEPSHTCGAAFDAEPDDEVPAVTITAPADGAVFDEDPARFDVEIAATDEGGWGVKEVRIRVDGDEQEAVDGEAPFGFGVTLGRGGYVLEAVAEDWAGNVAVSEPVAIGIDAPAPLIPDDEGGTAGTEESGEAGAGDDGSSTGCACAAPPGGIPPLAWLLPLARRRRAAAAAALVIGVALPGCQSNGGSSVLSAGTGSGTASDTTGSGTGTGDGDGDGDGDSSDDGVKFDTPDEGDATAEGGTADECTNVDILFVIDDSASMSDNQDSLIASFAGFVQGIQDNLALAQSYHVGVVTSDQYWENGDGCTDLGDLVTQTGGINSSQCVGTPFSSGKRWMDDTEPDLASKFACVAKVGSGGSDDEKMAGSMLGALAPANNGPGQCNDGFSRLDSLLVIVLITDEDDVPEPYGCDPDDPWNNPCDSTGSGGTPEDWHAQVLSYKANLPENVVVLSLLGRTLDNSCGAVVASKLIGFTNRFDDHGFIGDVCSESYDEFFAEALPIVDQACEDYVPPG